MPASHRAHLEWTPTKLITWGVSIGAPVGELVETILRTRPHPEHGHRACLMRLVRRYGTERLSAVCKHALATGSVSYGGAAAILKNGLDRVPVIVEDSPKIVPIQHANLRGSSYYEQALQASRWSLWRTKPLALVPWQAAHPTLSIACANEPRRLRQDLDSIHRR
jgi:hypothetical protein